MESLGNHLQWVNVNGYVNLLGVHCCIHDFVYIYILGYTCYIYIYTLYITYTAREVYWYILVKLTSLMLVNPNVCLYIYMYIQCICW